MVQDDKNILQKAWGSDPVQGFFNYPEYLRDERIQSAMETSEAFNEKGFIKANPDLYDHYCTEFDLKRFKAEEHEKYEEHVYSKQSTRLILPK